MTKYPQMYNIFLPLSPFKMCRCEHLFSPKFIIPCIALFFWTIFQMFFLHNILWLPSNFGFSKYLLLLVLPCCHYVLTIRFSSSLLWLRFLYLDLPSIKPGDTWQTKHILYFMKLFAAWNFHYFHIGSKLICENVM